MTRWMRSNVSEAANEKTRIIQTPTEKKKQWEPNVLSFKGGNMQVFCIPA